jgi:malonate transporter
MPPTAAPPYIALPIVSTAFGAPGLVLLLPIIALHSGVLLPLAAVLIEWGGRHGNSAVIGNTLKGVLRNPIVLSIALGFLWHAGRLPMAVPAHALFRLLAQAAPALALFCVGASLPQAASGYNREAALAAVCKLAALPAVIGMAAFAAGLSGLPVKVALVAAVMPTGANAFLVARRAPGFADASARTVVITLFAALPILSGLLSCLVR